MRFTGIFNGVYEGQLCFTTHNIGPMDILKRNSNSIDFISETIGFIRGKNQGIIHRLIFIGKG